MIFLGADVTRIFIDNSFINDTSTLVQYFSFYKIKFKEKEYIMLQYALYQEKKKKN